MLPVTQSYALYYRPAQRCFRAHDDFGIPALRKIGPEDICSIEIVNLAGFNVVRDPLYRVGCLLDEAFLTLAVGFIGAERRIEVDVDVGYFWSEDGHSAWVCRWSLC